MDITRERVTWTRWDADALRTRVSHPIVWIVTEPDGYQRTFPTKAEAVAFVARYVEESAL